VPPTLRLQALESKKENLEATLSSLQAQRSLLIAEAKLLPGFARDDSLSEGDEVKRTVALANAVVKKHIALLQKYKEIKDIGQGLMGLIAESKDVRIKTVMEDYGLEADD
jgi:hypothetical protein